MYHEYHTRIVVYHVCTMRRTAFPVVLPALVPLVAQLACFRDAHKASLLSLLDGYAILQLLLVQLVNDLCGARACQLYVRICAGTE